MFCTAAPAAPLSRLSTAAKSRILELHHDGLELAAAYGQEVGHEGDLRHFSHPAEHDLYLRRVPVARRAAHDPVRRDALVGRHEMGLDARPGPRSAHPGERVYGDGAHHPPHPAHHRREREYGRRGITSGVCYQPPVGSPEDLRQPVVCLPEQLRSGVLPVPLLVDPYLREAEVRREIEDHPSPTVQKLLYRPPALPVPVRHERRVQRRGIHLFGLDVLPLYGQLRIHLAYLAPRMPPRGDAHRPNLRVPREQAHQLRPHIPAPAVDANLSSHAAYCRVFG